MTVQNIGSVVRFLMSFSMKSTPKTENNQPEPTMPEQPFTNEELELMIDAIWRRQARFSALSVGFSAVVADALGNSMILSTW